VKDYGGYTDINSTVLIDPFAGTGTSVVSALQAGMFFVGNEISK
jgi:DNA modification methylase